MAIERFTDAYKRLADERDRLRASLAAAEKAVSDRDEVLRDLTTLSQQTREKLAAAEAETKRTAEALSLHLAEERDKADAARRAAVQLRESLAEAEARAVKAEGERDAMRVAGQTAYLVRDDAIHFRDEARARVRELEGIAAARDAAERRELAALRERDAALRKLGELAAMAGNTCDALATEWGQMAGDPCGDCIYCRARAAAAAKGGA